MNDSNKREFSEILLAMGEIYNKTVSKTLLRMYFDDLLSFSIEDVRKSFKKHRLDPKSGAFFPKPADIVRNIDGEQLSLDDRGNVAWMQIERAISSVGAYGSLALEDKQALAAVKAMGSWQQLCHTDRDKMAFKKSEFMANFKSLEHTATENLPDKLLGIEDLKNQRLGVDNQADNLMRQLENRNK